jgi:malonyl CoA-acyl carrier protein transacylase
MSIDILRSAGRLLNKKMRVFLAKILVIPVRWLYTEIMEEL